MKRISFFILVSLFFISVSWAQSLNESLGAIKTNFQILSDTMHLDIVDQQLILRAEVKEQDASVVIDYHDSPIRGLVFGYQSQHFEFISKRAIVAKAYSQVNKRKEGDPKKYQMIFYDADGNMLAHCFRKTEELTYEFNSSIENSLYFYSIDLMGIPLIILDKTSKINIVFLDSDIE